MNNAIKYAFIFVAGAAAGSFVTWKLLKTKYEQIAQEEIDSVKDAFKICSVKQHIVSDDIPESAVLFEELDPPEEEEADDHASYESVIVRHYYAGYESDKAPSAQSGPYVISPDEFGELEGYESISLSLYSDNVLADENDGVVENVEELVGIDSLSHFGEYEEDAVHVRNDALRLDIEILADSRTYTEVAATLPPNPLED